MAKTKYPTIEHKGRLIEDHTEDQVEADKRRKEWEDAHRPVEEKPAKKGNA